MAVKTGYPTVPKSHHLRLLPANPHLLPNTLVLCSDPRNSVKSFRRMVGDDEDGEHCRLAFSSPPPPQLHISYSLLYISRSSSSSRR
uniref:Uncharacterized protein n=1 Tax=Kalanchoe fedtschenkoi TaxID=63787 RepID=A0A7N0UJD4_KALFE